MKSATTWRRGAVAAALALPLAFASAGAALAADPAGTPTGGSTGYPAETPPPPPSLAVKSPVCDGNVPYLSYVVDVSNDPTATSVDLTWTSLDGTHSETQTGLPVSGKVLWLGATESGGKPTGWPGWVFKNGTWEEGGEYTWVRPTVRVTFTVHDSEYTSTPTATGAAASSEAAFSDGVYRSGTGSTGDAALRLPSVNVVSGIVSYPPATTACANPTLTTPSGSMTTPAGGQTTPGQVPTTPGKKTLAETGADVAPFAGAAVLLLGIGGVLVLLGRRRRSHLPHGS
ncbi:hypothetical protein [Luteimicrobium subarcticum]|uniref:LPXTG-motif cell wall-anchored protein n=1 Tax=Luteimicrobium subarcticum TaxID=620910 RepID=A0A2M8WVY0_9MICO|nr:hypothetical protein [Luteimicrobium subarcticum]PJI95080.1 hypothetical protein CLV34_0933 [Luteimicrobium subarcticum]